MRRELPSITENEWHIMKILWNAGRPCASLEIIAGLKGAKDISDRTVRVMLNRLVKKKAIDFNLDENHTGVYLYYPVIEEYECLKEKNRQLREAFFGGSVERMVTAMVADAELTDNELESLMNLLEQKRRK